MGERQPNRMQRGDVCVLMLQEMLGELFTPVETPEAPNRGFFKGLFGGGSQSLDREDLCKQRPTRAEMC